ncbi:unnamed protein product [Protopolystoma xenopodis]|uniref:Uncharacterized protein n=1 Tax=Protopolystoma xenopodis TaxID=117903 RepID=A0A3S5BMG8_9PLAT|nr:unnamed protein product [Protopolystoma xenopodis]
MLSRTAGRRVVSGASRVSDRLRLVPAHQNSLSLGLRGLAITKVGQKIRLFAVSRRPEPLSPRSHLRQDVEAEDYQPQAVGDRSKVTVPWQREPDSWSLGAGIAERSVATGESLAAEILEDSGANAGSQVVWERVSTLTMHGTAAKHGADLSLPVISREQDLVLLAASRFGRFVYK